MTIDAVHAAIFTFGDLFGCCRSAAIIIFSHVPLPVLEADPGNNLALIVDRNVGYFVGNIHVPVNPAHQTGAGTAATDIDQHTALPQRVLLVITVAVDHLHLLPKKFLGPMTLLA